MIDQPTAEDALKELKVLIGEWTMEAIPPGGEPWLAAKAPLARFYGSQVLSRAPGLAASVKAGGGDLEALSAEGLSV